MKQDPLQVLYHVTKVMEDRGDKLDQFQKDLSEFKVDIQKDLHEIKIDIAVMKQTGVMPASPEEIKKTRVSDTAKGGGVGGIIVAVIIGLWEYIKVKWGG